MAVDLHGDDVRLPGERKMTTNVLVLGDGTGGLVAANLLAKAAPLLLDAQED